MFRIILSLVFFSFLLINTQAQETVFLKNIEVDWLNNDVAKYNEAYVGLQEAYDKKDTKMLTDNKNIIVDAIRRFEKNGLRIINNFDSEELLVQRIANNEIPPSDFDPKLRYKQQRELMRKQGDHQEIAMNKADRLAFLDNFAQIKNIHDLLKHDNFILYPNNPLSKDNMDRIGEILVFATNANNMVKNKTVN